MANVVDARFAALLDELAAAMPDGESAARIRSGFTKHWLSPPLAELELVLRRTLPLAEARELLFFPEPADMPTYTRLIARAPTGAPAEHPQSRVRTPALGLLYMRHSREWRLMRPFLLAGGLKTLGDALGDENVYLRAQAIDVLVSLTSTGLHDWCAGYSSPIATTLDLTQGSSEPPLTQNLNPNTPYPLLRFAEPPLDPEVHRRWLDLASPEANFVSHVADNLGASFPGGSYYCLQALAFWLSLLRYFYCRYLRDLALPTSILGV